MLEFFKNLPWFIQYPARAIAAISGGYVSNHPEIFPSWAVLAGALVAIWVVLAFLWHTLNYCRERSGKEKLKLDPQLIVIACLLGALAAATWQWWIRGTSDAQIVGLQSQLAKTETELSNARAANTSAGRPNDAADAPKPERKNYTATEVSQSIDLLVETQQIVESLATTMMETETRFSQYDVRSNPTAVSNIHIRVPSAMKPGSEEAKNYQADASNRLLDMRQSELTKLRAAVFENNPVLKIKEKIAAYPRAIDDTKSINLESHAREQNDVITATDRYLAAIKNVRGNPSFFIDLTTFNELFLVRLNSYQTKVGQSSQQIAAKLIEYRAYK